MVNAIMDGLFSVCRHYIVCCTKYGSTGIAYFCVIIVKQEGVGYHLLNIIFRVVNELMYKILYVCCNLVIMNLSKCFIDLFMRYYRYLESDR